MMDPKEAVEVTVGVVPGMNQKESKDDRALKTGGMTTGLVADAGIENQNPGVGMLGMTPTELQAMTLEEKKRFLQNVELFAIMGIKDLEVVRKVLVQSNNDPDKAARILRNRHDSLLESSVGSSSQQPSSSPSSSSKVKQEDDTLSPPTKKARLVMSSSANSDTPRDEEENDKNKDVTKGEEELEECVICLDRFPKTSSSWRELKCGHRICFVCIDGIVIKEKSRSGQECIAHKCPICREITGEKVGTTPNGKSHVTLRRDMECEGYPDTDTIHIHYWIEYGPTNLINRTALLPFVPEGIEAFRRLRIGWDRRLCFEYVKRTPTDNSVLAWNSKLPQKTAYGGGPDKFGYPDPQYFEKLEEAAGKLGID